MLTVSRSSGCGESSSSRLRALPKPSALLGLFLAASRSHSEAPRCHLGPALRLCVTRALGRAQSPLRMMVSDLRSGADPSVAGGPWCQAALFRYQGGGKLSGFILFSSSSG